MQNVRLYARVSTEQQASEGDSLQSQISELKKFCDNNGYNVVKEYIEEGKSGKSIKGRDKLQELLYDVKKGEMVLFTKLDRLSRNLVDGNIIMRKWKDKGIKFKAILEPNMNIDDANSKMLTNIILSVSEHQREVTSERIKMNNRYRREQGLVTYGNLGLGYKVTEDKHAEIDDSEAQIVIEMFETYIQTRSFRTTKKIINDKYNKKLVDNTVRTILSDTKYLGDNTFPQIVSNELFENVKRIRECNGKARSTNTTYIFSGLLRCGYCGRSMVGNLYKVKRQVKKETTKLSFPRYRCNGSITETNVSCFSIGELKLEKMLLEKIKDDMLNTYVSDTYTNEEKDNTREIEKLKGKEKRLKRLYLDGDLEYEDYKTEINLVREEINKLSKEENKSSILLLEGNVFDIYETFDSIQKQAFWRTIVSRINVYKGHIDVFYNCI